MAAPEYLTINEFPVGVTGLYEFNFAGGYLEQAHVKLDFVTSLGARDNYPLTAGNFITEFTLQIPVIDLPTAAVSVRIYRETPRAEPLLSFTNGARLNERNLDRLAAQTIFVAAEAFDAGAFAVAEDLIGQALSAIQDAQDALAAASTIEGSAAASAASSLVSQNAAAASAALALVRQNEAAAQAADSAASAVAAASSAAAALVSQNAAASAANAALVSQNAAASAQAAAAGSATTASTQATSASNSASAAAGSVGAATTQAGIATTQAGIAATQAGIATTQANNAIATLANFPGRNKIINGKMEIAQRGAVFAAAPNTSYTLDRWQHHNSGTAANTISQSTSVPSDEFQSSLLYSCTAVDASVGATDYTFLRQSIEGYNARDLIGRTFTISFWVRSRKTGTHCVALGNTSADRSYVAEYVVNAVNTWEKKTITVAGGLITGGTWNWTNGLGLTVSFVLMCGPTFQTTPGAWQVGNFLATSNQVNLMDATGEAIRVTGVQLEVGAAATPFEHRLFGQELALCQRYLYVFESAGGGFGGIAIGYCANTTAFQVEVPIPVKLRAAPTFAFSGAVGGYAIQLAGGAVAVTGIGLIAAGPSSARFNFSVAGGLVAGQGGSLYAAGGVHFLYFSAEL